MFPTPDPGLLCISYFPLISTSLHCLLFLCLVWASQVALVLKNLPANAGDIRDEGSIPGSGRSPGEGNGTHSSIFAWEIPWTKEHGRLESMGLQKAGHNLVTEQQQQLKLLRINI